MTTVFYPENVLKAIKEKGVENILHIDYTHTHEGKYKKVSYISVRIDAYDENGKFVYNRPLFLRFLKLKTRHGMKNKQDRSESNNKDPFVSFRLHESGAYGEVKDIIGKEFIRQWTQLVADGKVENMHGPDDTFTDIQYYIKTTVHEKTGKARKIKDAKNYIPLDDPIIRIKIPMNKTTGEPMIQIYDLKKPIKNKRTGRTSYKLMTVKNEEGAEEPITDDNIHVCFPYGTEVTGIDRMDSISLHAHGVSFRSSLKDWVYVLPASNKINPEEVFNHDEFESLNENALDSDSSDEDEEDEEDPEARAALDAL